MTTPTEPPSTHPADIASIGALCAHPTCRTHTFLPFKCPSCALAFCDDHRTQQSHSCFSPKQTLHNNESTSSPGGKPSILSHDAQCSSPSCKTLIDTPLTPGIHCGTCRHDYCLKHRLPEDHDCAALAARVSAAQPASTKAEKALSRLRAWGASRKPSAAAKPGAAPPAAQGKDKEREKQTPLQRLISPLSAAKPPSSRTAQITALNALKSKAKGDSKIPPAKRIYVHLEAVADGGRQLSQTSSQPTHAVEAKIPKTEAFFSAEWSVGKVLDSAARMLDVRNVNNRVEREEERLRVFWVEGGRLLRFQERLGEGVGSGDTLVLLRGVGDPEAA